MLILYGYIMWATLTQVNPESAMNYDDIDWDTLPDDMNHTRTHVRDILGSRYGKGETIMISIFVFDPHRCSF